MVEDKARDFAIDEKIANIKNTLLQIGSANRDSRSDNFYELDAANTARDLYRKFEPEII